MNIVPSTFEIIRKVISENTVIQFDAISLDSSFTEDFKLDELDFILLIIDVEIEFDIYIPDEIIAKIKTVKNLVDYIDNGELTTILDILHIN